MAKKGSRSSQVDQAEVSGNNPTTEELTVAEKYYIEHNTLAQNLQRDQSEFVDYLELHRNKNLTATSLMARNAKLGFVAMTPEASSVEKQKNKPKETTGHIHTIKKT
jgi:hypothetical protein